MHAPPPRRQTKWERDLLSVQSETMTFQSLMNRHRRLVRKMVKSWLSRVSYKATIDDLEQEAWITIWQVMTDWDGSLRINSYVRMRVKYRLMRFTSALEKMTIRDLRYLNHQLIEEKVICVYGDAHAQRQNFNEFLEGEMFVAVTPPPNVEALDAEQVANWVISRLPSKQARVIAGIVNGQDTDTVTVDVYGKRCKRRRKAALRAIAAARELVEVSFSPLADQDMINGTHPQDNVAEEASSSRLELKPIRKAREPHTGQRHASASVG